MDTLIYGALGIGIIICGGILFTYFETLNTKRIEKTGKNKRLKTRKNFSV